MILPCADLKVDVALTTVSVGRMRGIPDPMMKVDGSELPFVTYKYFISYEFPNHRTPDNLVIHLSYIFPSHQQI